jgi:signal peptidase I
MRKGLKRLGNQERHTFTGVFERTGYKVDHTYATDYENPTLLLVNVKDESGKVITSHVWFNYTKGFKKLGVLQKGDVISFRARVGTYTKGYLGYDYDRRLKNPVSQDYKLTFPSKVTLVNRDPDKPLPATDFGLIEMIKKDNHEYYVQRDLK